MLAATILAFLGTFFTARANQGSLAVPVKGQFSKLEWDQASHPSENLPVPYLYLHKNDRREEWIWCPHVEHKVGKGNYLAVYLWSNTRSQILKENNCHNP
ncbi:hypothetical protein Nmel_002904 [Mimus melanotis]